MGLTFVIVRVDALKRTGISDAKLSVFALPNYLLRVGLFRVTIKPALLKIADPLAFAGADAPPRGMRVSPTDRERVMRRPIRRTQPSTAR